MINKTKYIKKILILILLLMNTLECCYAATTRRTTDFSEDKPTNENEYTEWTSDTEPIRVGNKGYRYRFVKKFSSDIPLIANVYDMKNNSVMPNKMNEFELKENDGFKSGTWVGINVTEIQTAYWSVSNFEYQEIKQKVTCSYEGKTHAGKMETKTCCYMCSSCYPSCSGKNNVSSSKIGPPGYYICTYKEQGASWKEPDLTETTEPLDFYQAASYKCPLIPGYENPKKTIETAKEYIDIGGIPGKDYVTIEAKRARESAANMIGTPSIYVSHKMETGDASIYGETRTGKIYKDTINTDTAKAGEIEIKYEFIEENVCINVLTSIVTYKRECEQNEIKIENGIVDDPETGPNSKYWHYFIPLNTKSTINNKNNKFLLKLVPNAEISATECESMIDNDKENYQDTIIPLTETGYTKLPNNIKKAKEIVSVGCQISINIEIPVEQKFYNEQEDNTFKGFNFYYKPIDVKNPFPNGIPKNSIWTSKETKKLTGTSFDKDDITYIADVTNAKAIRDYKNQETNHKKNLYTSWENMHVNGVSDFIENGGFVKRNIKKTDFYKLGCGPANEKKTNSDGTTNYLYQQECGTK